jgi:PPP family 3-phenylpropionic acid transporter
MAMASSVPLVRLAGFYFFYFAALGTFLPYWPLYLRDNGLGAEQIGWVMSILPATKLVSPAIWGWLADRTGANLAIIRHATLAGLLCFLTVPVVETYRQLLSALLAFGFFWNATLPLFEAATLAYLRQRANAYPRVRLWGSVGFIAAVGAIGWLLEKSVPVAALPLLIAVLLAGQLVMGLSLPKLDWPPRHEAGLPLSGVLSKPEVMAFLLACLLLQIAHGPYYVFFTVYLKEHGFGNAEAGGLWALGVLAEVGFFAMLNKVPGVAGLRRLFLASLALSALRWTMIAWLTDQLAWMLLAQLLHAASFGAAHAASIQLVQRYFSRGYRATGQALYGSVSFGLGGVLGSLFAGQLWTVWGPHWVFTAAAGFSLLALVVAWPTVGRKFADIPD